MFIEDDFVGIPMIFIHNDTLKHYMKESNIPYLIGNIILVNECRGYCRVNYNFGEIDYTDDFPFSALFLIKKKTNYVQ